MAHKDQKIYTISCPTSGYVFYVGRTSMELKKRLSCHLTDTTDWNPLLKTWFTKIKEQGKRPEILELESVPHLRRKDAEEYWTQQFSSWGFELANRRYVKNKSYQAKKRRFITLTDDERFIIATFHKPEDNMELAKMFQCSDETIRLNKYKRAVPIWFRDEMLKYYLKRVQRVLQWYFSYIDKNRS